MSITRLVYRYYGASIPPPYQRNAEIMVDAEKIRLTVTCVDEVLVSAEQPAPAGLLPQLTQWLQDDHLLASPRQATQPGQSPSIGLGFHTLTIYNGQQKIMDASTAQRADQATAMLSGEIESFARRLTHYVNHYDTYMHTP
ncbi:hypothetical protein [Methylophilus sp. 5]|uniref:hypothetical protein n=1 Tax=Methylophilus sp. 5 TaxID=1112274 RepID=UPI00055FE4FA|nr:hypothetical protein [Methylophilus sp. 5]